jgi:SAM-dependent methyltransferase
VPGTQLPTGGVSLVCPTCHLQLREASQHLHCSRCNAIYSIRDGIPAFAPEHPFYESRWAVTRRSPRGRLARIKLMFEEYGTLDFLNRHITGRNIRILDIGCGGGTELLRTKGLVTGVDFSHRSLAAAAQVYDQVVQADIGHLPFPDESFDCITSIWVLEHLSFQEFNRVLAELGRVLRRDGRMLHYFDTESQKPLLRWARRYPTLYAQYHVMRHGHVGLQPPSVALARLRAAGWRLRYVRGDNKSSVQYPLTTCWMFDNEYRAQARWLDAYVRLCRLARRRPRAERIVNRAILLYLRAVDRLLPLDYAFSLAVVCEKEDTYSDSG